MEPPGEVSRAKRYAYPATENDEIIWPIKMGGSGVLHSRKPIHGVGMNTSIFIFGEKGELEDLHNMALKREISC